MRASVSHSSLVLWLCINYCCTALSFHLHWQCHSGPSSRHNGWRSCVLRYASLKKKTCTAPKRYHLFVHQSAPAKDTHIEDDDDGSFPKFYSTLQSNQRHRSKPSLRCNLVAAGSLYPFQVARAKAFNALSPLEVAQSLWRGKKRIKRLIITRCS